MDIPKANPFLIRDAKERQIISIQGQEIRVQFSSKNKLCPYKTAQDIICSYLVMKQRAFCENPLSTSASWHCPSPPCHLMLAMLSVVS